METCGRQFLKAIRFIRPELDLHCITVRKLLDGERGSKN